VQTALKTMTHIGDDDLLMPGDDSSYASDYSFDSDTPPPRLSADCVGEYPEIWQDILQGDVIAKTCSLVVACRRSPQRRESLQNWIASGKASGKWDCKPLQLLRDVDTRWSSVYFTIHQEIVLPGNTRDD
jgi:hypothetical protein